MVKKNKKNTKRRKKKESINNSTSIVCMKSKSLPNSDKKENKNQYYYTQKENNNINIYDEKEDKINQNEKIILEKHQNNIKLIKFLNDDEGNIPKKNNVFIKDINQKSICSKNYKPKGLENFNFNCYMNSLLQCLFYLKDFRNYFLTNNFSKNQLMCLAMKDVMNGLNTKDGKSFFSPRKMKNEIKKDDVFKNGKGSDVTDLLDFIFYGIISELEKDSSSNHTVEYQTQTQNKRLVYRELYDEINFDIIVNNLFVGFYEKEFKCKNDHFK